jgi:hypothetical protein
VVLAPVFLGVHEDHVGPKSSDRLDVRILGAADARARLHLGRRVDAEEGAADERVADAEREQGLGRGRAERDEAHGPSVPRACARGQGPSGVGRSSRSVGRGVPPSEHSVRSLSREKAGSGSRIRRPCQVHERAPTAAGTGRWFTTQRER